MCVNTIGKMLSLGFIAVELVRTDCGRGGGGVTVYQPDSEDLQDKSSFSPGFNILDESQSDVRFWQLSLLLYDLKDFMSPPMHLH